MLKQESDRPDSAGYRPHLSRKNRGPTVNSADEEELLKKLTDITVEVRKMVERIRRQAEEMKKLNSSSGKKKKPKSSGKPPS